MPRVRQAGGRWHFAVSAEVGHVSVGKRPARPLILVVIALAAAIAVAVIAAKS